MKDAPWQRLLSLALLWPVLWLHGRHVRRITPRMPQPPGRRAGTAGRGSLVRLLVAGDSGAAGVGAATQDQALAGDLVRQLSRHHTVESCVLAANGLDSPGLLKLLQDAPSARFDVVVLSMGANDATDLCSPVQWAQWQNRLAGRLLDRCGRTMHWHPPSTTSTGMAPDGFHPSSDGYAAWAEGLSRHILAGARQLRGSAATGRARSAGRSAPCGSRPGPRTGAPPPRPR